MVAVIYKQLQAAHSALSASITEQFNKNALMLTVAKKALILAQAGIDVPRSPDFDASALGCHFAGEPCIALELKEGDAEQVVATIRWNQKIEDLFVIYTADQAARSLREAEQVRQIDVLRRANIHP